MNPYDPPDVGNTSHSPTQNRQNAFITMARKLLGVFLLLVAIYWIWPSVSSETDRPKGNASQSILDSPEASGRMIGTLFPAATMVAIGFWFLFSRAKSTSDKTNEAQ